MTTNDARERYCNVAGCTKVAEGALQLRYPKDWARFLCGEHLKPVHEALNRELSRAQRVALAHEVR